MDNETKQMFELLLSEIQSVRSDLTNEIKNVRSELSGEINGLRDEVKDIKLDVKSNNLEMKSLKLQMENNHYETKVELSKIHQKLDTIVNQVAKSAEDITALRLDMDKEFTNN